MKLPRRMAVQSIGSINFRFHDNDRIGFATKTPKLIGVSSRLFDLCLLAVLGERESPTS